MREFDVRAAEMCGAPAGSRQPCGVVGEKGGGGGKLRSEL